MVVSEVGTGGHLCWMLLKVPEMDTQKRARWSRQWTENSVSGEDRQQGWARGRMGAEPAPRCISCWRMMLYSLGTTSWMTPPLFTKNTGLLWPPWPWVILKNSSWSKNLGSWLRVDRIHLPPQFSRNGYLTSGPHCFLKHISSQAPPLPNSTPMRSILTMLLLVENDPFSAH